MSTILVIESDRHLLAHYKKELEGEGYKVIECATVSDAQSRARYIRELHLVLLELQAFSEGVNFLLLKIFVEINGDLGIINNQGFIRLAENSIACDADETLIKSGDLAPLMNLIRNILRQKHVERKQPGIIESPAHASQTDLNIRAHVANSPLTS